MNKIVRVVLLDDADAEFKRLNEIAGEQARGGKENTSEMQLLKSIKQKSEFIKSNPFYGDSIPKNKIPDDYIVTNLWRVEITGYWRMLYTIKGDTVEIVCFILDILDHPSYDKKFKYKKK